MTSESEEKRSHWPISILSSIASVVNLLMPLVLVRLLSPEEIGTFKIFFLYLTMVPAFSLVSGFLDGLAYWSGQAKDRSVVALQISALMMFSVALLFSIGGLLLHRPLAELLEWESTYALLFSLSLFGAIAGTFFEEAIITQGRIWYGAFFSSGYEIFRAVLIVSVTLSYPSLLTVMIVHALVSSGKTLLSALLAIRLGLLGLEWNAAIFKATLRYAMPVSLAWMFGIFVSYADQFILSLFIPVEEFAFYTIGCLLIPMLFVLEHSICRVMIPLLSGAFARDEQERAARLYREAVENIAFLVVPAVAGLYVFAEPIITLLYTDTYASSADYLRIFCFSYLAVIIPFDAVARAKGQSRWLFRSFVLFSVIAVLLTLVLVQFFGTYGALAALLIVRFSMRVYALRYMHGVAHWTLADALPIVPLLQFIVISLFLSITSIAVRPLFATQLYWFLLVAPLFALFYFVILGLWKVRRRKDERRQKRILLLLPTLGIGGMERMVLHVATELRSRSFEVFVFAFDVDPSSEYPNLQKQFEEVGCVVSVHGKREKRFFSPKAIVALLRFINTYDLTIVHSHNLGSLIHAVLVKWFSIHRLQIVHTQHSFVHLQEKSRYAHYEKFFCRFVASIACVSPETKRQYRELGVPEKLLHVIPNGILVPNVPVLSHAEKIAVRKKAGTLPATMDGVHEKLLNQSDTIWLLNLARMDSIKGQSALLDLWNSLPSELRSNFSLLFVGPEAEAGFMELFRQKLSECADSERVHVCGASQKPEEWYAIADISVSASSFEGMPLGPLEAIAAGLPAVLSDIEGHRFLGKDASYFHNAESFGQALQQCLSLIDNGSDEGERKERAARVVTEHGVQKMADRYIALYSLAWR